MGVVLNVEQKDRVLANLALVEHIVNRVMARMPPNHSRDDLVQTGIMGLISAAVRFDPDHGTSFATFAGRRIEGEIVDVLRRTDWAPRSVRRMERRLNAMENDRRGSDSIPSVQQLSTELGMEPADLNRLRQDIARARLDSLDRPVGQEGSAVPLSSTIVDAAISVDESVDRQELLGYLRKGINLLPERHRCVIVGYFFDDQTMTDIGAYLGVTQSRASQMKDEALSMLRNGLDVVYDEQSGGEPSPNLRGVRARQVAFNNSLASAPTWQARVASGHGVSVTT